ncbi:BRCT domain-containing protein [Chromohalobacter israelensis]|uniref:BRCT domain-containing protein n=1 Tax=Chromohalobacter israelensis TaxID=141390 RepID=UPI0015C474DA|nr:BRCT domain-containing protein [Chromohalobacter salexigens]NWO55012.1 hypothetical protein [Chromohalobacter salexigens]
MDVVRFVYEDAKGNVSMREVAQWVDDGWQLKGICSSDSRFKTFRRDRIVEVLTDPGLLVAIQRPAHLAPQQDPSTITSSPSLEILFTGFPKARRAALEEYASEAGMRLRKTVSKELSFVCAGPNAGSTKLRKAQGQCVAVLDESDFLWLLGTGELPE